MIPIESPFVLFLRHAERHAIPADDPYADVDLTDAGYRAADALGAELDGRLAWTAASPFRRCVATARALGAEPERETRLGSDGPWVVDSDAAGRAFAELGTERVVAAQVAGKSVPGMRAPEEAVPLLLSAGLDRLARGSGACISHDAILMPAMAWLFGADACETWLSPLDGFVLVLTPRGPEVRWRGRVRPC